jgi:tRNA nucleotidyltransferase/poly(A) polymerase
VTKSFQFFEVGGCIRDELLGLTSKDVDFTAVPGPGYMDSPVEEVYSGLVSFLESENFIVRDKYIKFMTVKASVPEGNILRERTRDADFVLARKEGPYSDGRRPDWVKPGTLHDDLARRDFTVNAIARDLVSNELVDPFDGGKDASDKTLRFVGDPEQRIREDGLRIPRAWRFEVVKGLAPTVETWEALNSDFAAEALSRVDINPLRQELEKMFLFDTVATLELLFQLPNNIRDAVFRDNLRLSATTKTKMRR